MKRVLRAFLVVLMMIGVGCSGSSGDSSGEADSDLSDDSWRLVAGDVEAGMEFNSPTGDLTVVNRSGRILERPEVYAVDEESGERIDLELTGHEDEEIGIDETVSYTVTHHTEEGPDSESLMGVRFGEHDYGLFHEAETFSSLPPHKQEVGVVNSGITPTPGTWVYTIEMSDVSFDGADCQTVGLELMAAAGVGFNGTGTLMVNDGGTELFFETGNVEFFMDLTSLTGNHYESQVWPLPSTSGEENTYADLDYTFDIESETAISGSGAIDTNEGCTGSFSFAMALQAEAEETAEPSLCEGEWVMSYEYDTFGCSGTALTLGGPGLVILPLGTVNLSPLPPGTEPYALTLQDTDTEVLILLARQAGTNFYGSLSTYFPVGGTTVVVAGTPFSALLTASFYFEAVSNESLDGAVQINGTAPACQITIPATIQFNGDC